MGVDAILWLDNLGELNEKELAEMDRQLVHRYGESFFGGYTDNR